MLKEEDLPDIPPRVMIDIQKTNDVSVKLIRCLCAPVGGRYLLNAKFKKVALNECTAELFPKTREAALAPRRKLDEMTEQQIIDIKKALLEDTKFHLEVAGHFDGSLLRKTNALLSSFEGIEDDDIHVPQSHGGGHSA